MGEDLVDKILHVIRKDVSEEDKPIGLVLGALEMVKYRLIKGLEGKANE